MATAAEIRHEGPRSCAPYSWDEDHTESKIATVVPVPVRLHPMNSGAIQHAHGSICFDTATCQSLAITEGQSEIHYKGGSYEVGTIRTGCWLLDVRYGRDAAKDSACSWRRKQIHAQFRPPTLECSEAYLQISCWHTTLRHHIRTARTLRPSRLYWLRLRGCLDSRKSTSGYFRFEHGAISWRSKLQDYTAMSTTKAEYVAASDAAKEALWLGRLACTFWQANPKCTPTVLATAKEL